MLRHAVPCRAVTCRAVPRLGGEVRYVESAIEHRCEPRLGQGDVASLFSENMTNSWLRTSGVDTNGAAAKVVNVDRLEEKVRPGTFGKIKVV